MAEKHRGPCLQLSLLLVLLMLFGRGEVAASESCQVTGTYDGGSDYYCVNMSLAEVPAMFNGDTTRINLDNNKLTRVSDMMFGTLTKLSHIILENNHISTISLSAFDGLYELAILYLDMNDITYISQRMFAQLSKLVLLTLTSNAITSIEMGTFAANPDLVFVGLAHNMITAIASHVFSGLTEIYKVDLESNVINCTYSRRSLNITCVRCGDNNTTGGDDQHQVYTPQCADDVYLQCSAECVFPIPTSTTPVWLVIVAVVSCVVFVVALVTAVAVTYRNYKTHNAYKLVLASGSTPNSQIGLVNDKSGEEEEEDDDDDDDDNVLSTTNIDVVLG